MNEWMRYSVPIDTRTKEEIEQDRIQERKEWIIQSCVTLLIWLCELIGMILMAMGFTWLIGGFNK